MPELTLEQTNALDRVRQAKAERASIRARVEAANRLRMEEATRDAEAVFNRAVREAFETGVSKRRIGREGLGTVDPTIVNRILEKTEGEAALAGALAAVTAVPPIRELTRAQAADMGFADADAELFVELHYPNFPTRWPAGGDPYPDPLTGVLKRVFGLWTPLRDPELALAWELDEVEENGGVLARVLDAYAEKALAARA